MTLPAQVRMQKNMCQPVLGVQGSNLHTQKTAQSQKSHGAGDTGDWVLIANWYGVPSGIMKVFWNEWWPCEYTKNYWIIHFKRWVFMVCTSLLNFYKRTYYHILLMSSVSIFSSASTYLKKRKQKTVISSHLHQLKDKTKFHFESSYSQKKEKESSYSLWLRNNMQTKQFAF